MSLQAVAYASLAVPRLSTSELDQLVQAASLHNRLAGVSGLLLFDGSRFLQYIEGPDSGIAVVYSRILASRFHTDVIELARSRVGERRMPYWAMRWLPTDKARFNEAAFSDWTSLVPRGKPGSRAAKKGIDHLAELAAPHLSCPG